MKSISKRVIVALSSLAVVALASGANAANGGKILVCHASGSTSSPYVLISVNARAFARFSDGHGSSKNIDLLPGPDGTCGGNGGGD
jgi:hypothetical protein